MIYLFMLIIISIVIVIVLRKYFDQIAFDTNYELPSAERNNVVFRESEDCRAFSHRHSTIGQSEVMIMVGGGGGAGGMGGSGEVFRRIKGSSK